MMGGLRAWLLGIVLTAFAGGLARQLTGQGREQAVVRLVGGLLLTLALLQPLSKLDWEGPALEAASFRVQSGEQAEIYRKNQAEALRTIIEEKTGAYILDKANRLGLDCTVSVTAAAGESGIPLPDTVTIRGGYSEMLAVCIEEEVGIPAEKQFWLEEKAWTETKES